MATLQGLEICRTFARSPCCESVPTLRVWTLCRAAHGIQRCWSKSCQYMATHGRRNSFFELQPLTSKDGPTVATEILDVVEEILACVAAGYPSRAPTRILREVHILFGGSVSTSENVATQVLRHMMLNRTDIGYLLVVAKCASPQSNLVVMTAICREKWPIAGSTVLSSYSEGFTTSLWPTLAA